MCGSAQFNSLTSTTNLSEIKMEHITIYGNTLRAVHGYKGTRNTNKLVVILKLLRSSLKASRIRSRSSAKIKFNFASLMQCLLPTLRGPVCAQKQTYANSMHRGGDVGCWPTLSSLLWYEGGVLWDSLPHESRSPDDVKVA